MGVCSAQERTIHDQREFAVGKEGEQDVTDVLWHEVSVMEHPRHGAGLGFECGIAREMERDLAVQRGFSLDQREEHFRDPLQRIQVTMRETAFQVGRKRVSMETGRIGDRHRLRYSPSSC